MNFSTDWTERSFGDYVDEFDNIRGDYDCDLADLAAAQENLITPMEHLRDIIEAERYNESMKGNPLYDEKSDYREEQRQEQAEWDAKREREQYDGWICPICGSPHHMEYEHLALWPEHKPVNQT